MLGSPEKERADTDKKVCTERPLRRGRVDNMVAGCTQRPLINEREGGHPWKRASRVKRMHRTTPEEGEGGQHGRRVHPTTPN